jgi:hypothetical protein
LKYAGTVITASVTVCHRNFSASSFSFISTCAPISSGLISFQLNSISADPSFHFTTLKGTDLISSSTSSYFLPINLLAEKIVQAGFVIACLFAGVQTMIFQSLLATIEGVVLFHSAFGITFASHHSITATQEFVVHRSIQIIFHIFFKVKN